MLRIITASAQSVGTSVDLIEICTYPCLDLTLYAKDAEAVPREMKSCLQFIPRVIVSTQQARVYTTGYKAFCDRIISCCCRSERVDRIAINDKVLDAVREYLKVK